MAQTLGVYHYGYFTLNKRDIQYHGPTAHPNDQYSIHATGQASACHCYACSGRRRTQVEALPARIST